MVQIHGKGRYKIIATQSIMVLIGGVSIGVSVLVSISQGGGIGNGSLVLVDDGLDGLGISDGGGVADGDFGIGLGDLLEKVIGGGVDDGLLTIIVVEGGVSMRIVSISVVENLGISLGLGLSFSLSPDTLHASLVKSVVLSSIRISVVVDIRGCISDGGGNVDPGVGNFRLGVDHGVVVVDIRSMVGIDMGNMGLVHSGIGLSLHVDSRVMDHSSVVSDLSGLNAGGVHNGLGRGQSQKRSNNLSNKEKYE